MTGIDTGGTAAITVGGGAGETTCAGGAALTGVDVGATVPTLSVDTKSRAASRRAEKLVTKKANAIANAPHPAKNKMALFVGAALCGRSIVDTGGRTVGASFPAIPGYAEGMG